MDEAILAAGTLAATPALPACSSGSYADVVRFHANQPINRGTLFIQPADPAIANSLEFRAHAESLAVQIQRQADTVNIREGQAAKTASAGNQESTLAWAVPALAGAMFRDFPGTHGATVQVRQ